MTITEFLLARIAEDETMAQAASQGEWIAVTGSGPKRRRQQTAMIGLADMRGQGEAGCLAVFAGLNPNRADDADHAARHDPTRVLAECKAKRAIVEIHDGTVDGERNTHPCDGTLGVYECDTLRALAAVYADHADYNPEWAA